MGESYELTTIRDIFDKVPADRIQECCRELGVLLAQTKALTELVGATVEAIGGPALSIPLPQLVGITFPIVWVDDDKGELTTRVGVGGDEVLTMTTQRAASDKAKEPSHE